ncbi:MAG: fumarate hydratase, partial [Polyangiaceae bacterium]|nr:fumarate hydratase [Polyangiaceae bacterium]
DDATPYRKLTSDHVSTATFAGETILKVEPEALTLLCREAMKDIAHLLRPGHLAQLRAILDDPEATANDKFVALELLKNANIASAGVLPSCQDTGTAIILGKKGQRVFTGGGDEAALARGVFDTYQTANLRYSQMAPLDMYREVNTKTNLPAQIELFATDGDAYKFLFMAKGGGSANKTYLYQETKALLNPESLLAFVDAKMRTLGTSACPPYHLVLVVGGLSAEQTLKTVKLASARYLDGLPTKGSETGHAFRDIELEQQILELAQKTGIGAQFGGKYFCHDVRVIRLPRHGASCPVGLGVSCSADRQALGKITKDGVFLEELERDPAHYLPDAEPRELGSEVI